MKKNLGKKNWMFPMPVLMIGTYGEDGTPNVMNAAWGGITLEDEITICIDTSHRTWANIAARKAFTVAFGTADKVAACDYLGLVSGNKTPDKVKKSGLTVTKSEFVDAPVINELPLVLECALVSMNEENCNVVGKIVNCAVEESALTEGKPDAAKMKPLCFDTCAHVYRIMGDVVADAFSVQGAGMTELTECFKRDNREFIMATTLSAEEIKSFKGRGWLHNKGTDTFSARIVTVNGKVSASQLQAVAEAARKFGTGEVTFTSRQGIEVLGVPADKTTAFEAALEAAGLSVGGTGPKVRPVTSCKGTVCPRGLIDTFSLSQKIHARFYVGWHDVALPAKFKIGVGGCPNNCIKPNLNDIGVTGAVLPEGGRGYLITLGGHWGRTGAAGVPVPVLLRSEDDVLAFIDRTLAFYRDNGQPGERFFKTLERIGFDTALKMIG